MESVSNALEIKTKVSKVTSLFIVDKKTCHFFLSLKNLFLNFSIFPN